jgi:prohibitin 2
MSAPDPKEAWARIQNELTRRSQRFGGSGGGAPKGLFGGIGGLLLVGGGIWAANNALFNGVWISAWKTCGLPGVQNSLLT